MPYTTLVAGTTITSSWANTNIRDQVVTPFATTAARDSAITSPVEGMVAYTTDTDSLWVYTGAAWVQYGQAASWTDFTPTLTASTTPPTLGSGSVTEGHYMRIGRHITYHFFIKFGTSGAAAGSGNYRITLPAAPRTTASDVNPVLGGSVTAYDDSSSTYSSFPYAVYLSASGFMEFRNPLVNQASPWTWSNLDLINGTIVYEAAS